MNEGAPLLIDKWLALHDESMATEHIGYDRAVLNKWVGTSAAAALSLIVHLPPSDCIRVSCICSMACAVSAASSTSYNHPDPFDIAALLRRWPSFMVEDFRNFSTKMVPILKDTKFKAMSSESDSNVARVQGAGRGRGGKRRCCSFMA